MIGTKEMYEALAELQRMEKEGPPWSDWMASQGIDPAAALEMSGDHMDMLMAWGVTRDMKEAQAMGISFMAGFTLAVVTMQRMMQDAG